MEPEVALRQLAAEPDGAPGLWKIHWRIDNLGGAPLQIISARIPHGQFKAADRTFLPPLGLPAHGQAEFHSEVRCQELAGLVTENAFVILHCQWRGAGWRTFVRIRVTVNGAGEPQTATELITSQEIGFSGIAN